MSDWIPFALFHDFSFFSLIIILSMGGTMSKMNEIRTLIYASSDIEVKKRQ
jgi:hypothetical protein